MAVESGLVAVVLAGVLLEVHDAQVATIVQKGSEPTEGPDPGWSRDAGHDCDDQVETLLG